MAGHFGGTLGYCAALMFPPVGVGTVVALGLNPGRMHTAAEHALWQSWLLEKVYPYWHDALVSRRHHHS